MTKKEIREIYQSLRNQMAPGQVRSLSAGICEIIKNSEYYQNARRIYAYCPIGNEADIRPIISDAWKRGKKVAFPKVFGKEMRYFQVRDFSELRVGTFGVPEPPEDILADWPDALVLVPGVAFDRDGNRMGYGGGYYDRYFARKTSQILLGVACELQIAKSIPAEETDRRMDAVATETGIFLPFFPAPRTATPSQSGDTNRLTSRSW